MQKMSYICYVNNDKQTHNDMNERTTPQHPRSLEAYILGNCVEVTKIPPTYAIGT